MGDYTSMIFLLRHPPGNGHSPSMSVRSIHAFVNHKFLPQGSPLSDLHNNTVLDIDGNPITCEGTIKAQQWLKTFYASIVQVHRNNQRDGPFVSQCLPCLASKPTGCQHHAPICQWMNRGNPCNHTAIHDQKDWLRKESIRRQYKSHSKSPFLPSDLNNIQQYMMLGNFDITNLRFFTLLLCSIECALRFDGMAEATVDNFERNSSLWKVTNGVIRHLCQSVKEKNDAVFFQHLHVFRDSHPKLCFLRHLLVLVHCTERYSGCLFGETPEEPLNYGGF